MNNFFNGKSAAMMLALSLVNVTAAFAQDDNSSAKEEGNRNVMLNAARDQILSDYGFGGRTMTRIDYDELCDRAEEAEISRRESVLGKLSDLSSRTDTPAKAAKAKEAER